MPLRRALVLILALSTLGLVGLAPATSATASPSPAPTSGCNLGLQPVAGPLDLPLGLIGACPSVRPGSPVRTPLGLCSLNFMFKGSDGFTYMGTAGHCVLQGTPTKEIAWGPGEGPPAADVNKNPIGRFAYAVQDGRRDFSLIRLIDGVQANPQVCFFGGPTGLDNGPVQPLGSLHQFGQGRLFGAIIPARSQLALEANPDQVLGAGLAAPGDSGGPLLTDDGRAAGVVVATGPALLGLVATGVVFSTRLGPQLQRATEVTGVRYELQTAPRL
ncbi:MAG: trypsin-like serine protease [Acidimicrobiales bacterium]